MEIWTQFLFGIQKQKQKIHPKNKWFVGAKAFFVHYKSSHYICNLR
jgi:hypothetical protein